MAKVAVVFVASPETLEAAAVALEV
jgi:hypothetical protein